MIKLSRINVTPALAPAQTPHQWFRLIYESITQLESNTGLGKWFKHFIIRSSMLVGETTIANVTTMQIGPFRETSFLRI